MTDMIDTYENPEMFEVIEGLLKGNYIQGLMVTCKPNTKEEEQESGIVN